MAYDEELAERARSMVASELIVGENAMFGGLAVMINGHMAFGVMKDSLMLRLDPDEDTAALGQPHVAPMDFTGRPMRSMVLVGPGGLDDAALRTWVARAATAIELAHAEPDLRGDESTSFDQRLVIARSLACVLAGIGLASPSPGR